MPPLPPTVSAVLIAGSQTPLEPDECYAIHWSGGTAPGRIRCITHRLNSPFVTPSPDSVLRPRELASVEIEMASPVLPATLDGVQQIDRKSTRLNSSHLVISYAVFCLKKKNIL